MAKDILIPITHEQVPPTLWVKWRHAIGWTQREAAEWLGVSLRSYEGWEAGALQRHPQAMRRLMQAAQKSVRPIPERKRKLRVRKKERA